MRYYDKWMADEQGSPQYGQWLEDELAESQKRVAELQKRIDSVGVWDDCKALELENARLRVLLGNVSARLPRWKASGIQAGAMGKDSDFDKLDNDIKQALAAKGTE